MTKVMSRVPLGTKSRVIIAVAHDWLKKHDTRVSFMERPEGWHRRDSVAWRTASLVADGLTKNRVGAQVIRAVMPRRYCDVNRPVAGGNTYDSRSRGVAYVDPSMGAYYDAYHQAIDQSLKMAEDHFSQERILFIDWHSFAAPDQSPFFDAHLVVGTAGGCAIQGRNLVTSMSATMTKAGCRLTHSSHTGQSAQYCGGYTVRRVAAVHQLAAVQVEVNERLWQKDHADVLVRTIKKAITNN